MSDRAKIIEDAKIAVMLAIRRGHNSLDTQTSRDRQAAVEVIKELERLGWMDPYTIRVLVSAAGGKIDLEDAHFDDPPEELMLFRRHNPPGYTLRTRRVVRLDLGEPPAGSD